MHKLFIQAYMTDIDVVVPAQIAGKPALSPVGHTSMA
jgi:hypothetical protein